VRIWDIDPECLCGRHLLGEHSELHAVWSILTEGKAGYSRHPETKRWEGRLKALYLRHERLAEEMRKRGYRHRSPLYEKLATGDDRQSEFIDSIERQKELLRGKGCECLPA
jgi:hypothetical protein